MKTAEDYLTKEKFHELERELGQLKTVKRKEVAEALEYAKSLGDLSENQEYQEARDNQAILEDRINRLDAVLKSAKIVSTKNIDIVMVGSVVTVEKESDKSLKSYTMVGSEEVDAANGKISIHSPLGLSAMGKSKEEIFSFKTPSGIMSYKIIDIK
ncbi:MAG: transcription elongation factor GreA [Candidatus Zambryskibacteria bacterium CG_4_9_14_3_um_filter_42_9]|uniref:Transcription elongation factor GreA n=1 Tax=Candidatus Zambryskibacteria bacterium CG22_combo_CG10-13_8_21_14_all_42_17 TaxID=1975118 RepID=A0A2H0BE87_9BACT|nr:MAG: transcription elongation factor GreA [Candidatus Zambryskibacteria bacterium CG22_combo_CG10-13_8_21_14_all_42_17]PJA36854.1 MAG: transcription elongation factor GreA [Candidatus Zambryskibacteria bacterium CG_4_9_14_3_um_filter_42_9]